MVFRKQDMYLRLFKGITLKKHNIFILYYKKYFRALEKNKNKRAFEVLRTTQDRLR